MSADWTDGVFPDDRELVLALVTEPLVCVLFLGVLLRPGSPAFSSPSESDVKRCFALWPVCFQPSRLPAQPVRPFCAVELKEDVLVTERMESALGFVLLDDADNTAG